MGALPTLYAATVPDLPGGTFVGPDGFMEQRGHPHVVTAAGKAYDEAAWRRLWEISEELTGVPTTFSAPPARRVTDLRARRRGGARVGGGYLERVRRAAGAGAGRAGRDPRRAAGARARAAEPFCAVLRDLDEVLLPGVTHWQHPRYFAYFATSASEPAILAELLAATLNSVAILWRTAPAATELEGVVLDWVADLLGLPGGLARPHRGQRLDLDAGRDHRRPRGHRARPRRVLRAGPLLGREGGADARACGCARCPCDDELRMRPDALGDLAEAAVVVATVGTTATTSVDPVPAIADACARGRDLAARRRRLRRRGDGVPGAPLGVRRRRAGRLAGRQRPQVDAHADGLLAAVEPRGREDLRARVQPDPRVPAHARRRGRAVAERVRPGAGPPLPGAEAVGGAALPRPPGPAGAHPPRGRARGAVRGVGGGRAGLGAVRAAPFSVVCFRLRGEDERNRALLERVNASGEIFISHAVLDGRYVLRLAVGQMRTTEADVARPGTCCDARRAGMTAPCALVRVMLRLAGGAVAATRRSRFPRRPSPAPTYFGARRRRTRSAGSRRRRATRSWRPTAARRSTTTAGRPTPTRGAGRSGAARRSRRRASARPRLRLDHLRPPGAGSCRSASALGGPQLYMFDPPRWPPSPRSRCRRARAADEPLPGLHRRGLLLPRQPRPRRHRDHDPSHLGDRRDARRRASASSVTSISATCSPRARTSPPRCPTGTGCCGS